MPKVAIPPTHFTHNVKKNYQEHRSALIREFLQNSVDAKSKNIKFNFCDNYLIVQDDGCGMTSDILVNALLTMSGSFKGENSIGGFGAAKEILLFQHERYHITTSKNGEICTVIGNQLDYEWSDCHLDLIGDSGTTIKIDFHESYDVSSMCHVIKSYLHDCQTSQNIYLNDELIESDSIRGDLVDKGLDWAEIYVSANKPSHYVAVRINGVKMFDVYVSDLEHEVIVELTKPSLEILTVNRDGFVWKYQNDLSKLIYEISVEKGQFGRAFNEHKVWRGQSASYNDINIDFSCILEHNDNKFAESEKKHIISAIQCIARIAKDHASSLSGSKSDIIDEMKNKVKQEAQLREIPDTLIDLMIQKTNELICDHDADFYIKVTGKGFDKIPDNLKPGNWGKRTISWAKLWKHCIKLVMKSNGISEPYSIGWVIDNDEKVEAMYMKVDGINVFYMNPLLTWMCSSNHANVFHKMLMNACHEVAHMSNKYHDERFIIHYENLLHRTLCNIVQTKNSWWREYLASKHETI